MAKKTKNRDKEYHRALASLSGENAAVALACFVFTSLHQKQACLAAMAELESQGGFVRWGKFSKTPEGISVAVSVPVKP